MRGLTADSVNLQDRDMFVQAAKRTPVDLREWAVGLMERDNRKSHLAPQLSPSTQALLRGDDSSPATGSEDKAPSQTPTYGDIPIGESSSRSSNRNGSGHPGMGARGTSSSSITKVGGYAEGGGSTFSLPVRSAPTRRDAPEDARREARRGQ